MEKQIDPEDLGNILSHTETLWEELRGQRLFITGGTGFFGHWLLESFVWANRKLKLGAHAVVLSRDPEDFAKKNPMLAGKPSLKFIRGDVRTFDFPKEDYPFVIHAATEASAKLVYEDPQAMFDTIVLGTRRVLEFSRTHGTKKMLFTSSGAVYGRQPPEMERIPEDYHGAPDLQDLNSAYGEGKRVAETLCALTTRDTDMEIKIARCFAFVGPYLPLDAHFAIGNFIRDALNGGPIIVNGDGTPFRSYLYASDLASWLWTLLIKGKSNSPYNVGSDRAISIADLAKMVQKGINPNIDVQIRGKPTKSKLAERYIPSIEKIKTELGLTPSVSLKDGILRTYEWYIQK